jgi:hypothetical protein
MINYWQGAGRGCPAFFNVVRIRNVFIAVVFLPAALWGQSTDTPNTDNLYHWAYATAFGTGAYQVGEDRVLVVRVNPAFELARWEPQRLALNLKLPVTIGVQDIDLGSAQSQSVDIDEFIQTMSLVPGLELVGYPRERWRLKPFGQYGWGTQLGGSESAQIYYAGVNSRYTMVFSAFNMDLLNGIHWLGYKPNQGSTDNLSRLITGLEWELALGEMTLAQQQALLRPHIAHFWYFDDLGFQQIQSSPVELKQEFEIGLALGTPEPMSLGFFKFDRIGLAFRLSENIQGFRLIFGSIMN